MNKKYLSSLAYFIFHNSIIWAILSAMLGNMTLENYLSYTLFGILLHKYLVWPKENGKEK